MKRLAGVTVYRGHGPCYRAPMRNTGAQGRAWADFSAWCRRRGLRALPAHPWTLAAYLRWCEERHRYPAIVKRIGVIARAHLLGCQPAPHRHPTVLRTLRTIERRALGQSSALFRDGDFLAVGGPAPKNAAQPRRRGPKGQAKGLRTAPRLVARRPT